MDSLPGPGTIHRQLDSFQSHHVTCNLSTDISTSLLGSRANDKSDISTVDSVNTTLHFFNGIAEVSATRERCLSTFVADQQFTFTGFQHHFRADKLVGDQSLPVVPDSSVSSLAIVNPLQLWSVSNVYQSACWATKPVDESITEPVDLTISFNEYLENLKKSMGKSCKPPAPQGHSPPSRREGKEFDDRSSKGLSERKIRDDERRTTLPDSMEDNSESETANAYEKGEKCTGHTEITDKSTDAFTSRAPVSLLSPILTLGGAKWRPKSFTLYSPSSSVTVPSATVSDGGDSRIPDMQPFSSVISHQRHLSPYAVTMDTAFSHHSIISPCLAPVRGFQVPAGASPADLGAGVVSLPNFARMTSFAGSEFAHSGWTQPAGVVDARSSRRPGNSTLSPAGKKYSCDVCGQSFSRSNTLVTHKRIHTGDKPFKCERCGRAFRQPGNLTRHRLTHTAHKPYFCVLCGKAFNRASNLNTHVRTHASVRSHACPTCGKEFNGETKRHVCEHRNSSTNAM